MYGKYIPERLSQRAAAPVLVLLSWLIDGLVYRGDWEFAYTGDKQTEREIGRSEGLLAACVALFMCALLFISEWSTDYTTGIVSLVPILISGIWCLLAIAHIEQIRIEEVG